MSSTPPPSPSEQEPRSLQFEDWLTVIVMAALALITFAKAMLIKVHRCRFSNVIRR